MAVRLNGQNLTRTANVFNYNQPYTFMAWINLVDRTAYHGFLANKCTTENSYDEITLEGVSPYRLYGASRNTTTYVAGNGNLTLATGQWYHVAIVRSDGSTMLAYLNGVLSFTLSKDESARTSTNLSMVLGRNAANHWTAAVKAWTVALSPSGIYREMLYGVPIRHGGLVSHLPLIADVIDRASPASVWTLSSGSFIFGSGPPVRWSIQPIILSAPAAAAGVTATASATLDALTVSSVANTTNTATGSAALAALTSTAAATMPAVGTASATLDALTSTATANTTNTATGTATLADLTSASAATLGSLPDITAAAVATLAAVTVTATATLTVMATASATLADVAYVPIVVITHYRSTQLLLFPYQATYEVLVT